MCYLPALACAWLFERMQDVVKFGGHLLSVQIVRESFYCKYFSSSKARRELNWSPKVTLEDAVIGAVDYYKSVGRI
jgi:nucleoside-diphosphate-sugar epimerase